MGSKYADYHRAHIWQLEYQQEGQGIRVEIGVFPNSDIDIHHRISKYLLFLTPSSQYWKTSFLVTQPTSSGYVRFVAQTQSGNCYGLGVPGCIETHHTSQIRRLTKNPKNLYFVSENTKQFVQKNISCASFVIQDFILKTAKTIGCSYHRSNIKTTPHKN